MIWMFGEMVQKKKYYFMLLIIIIRQNYGTKLYTVYLSENVF
jgi:hypothetical protein